MNSSVGFQKHCEAIRVVAWGSFDLGKPRTRIILRGLQECGAIVHQCGAQIWKGVEDKTRLSALALCLRLVRLLASYPILIRNYFRIPDHDIVLVGYPGLVDVLVIAPFAMIRGKPVVWDMFLSVHDALVCDRKLIGRGNPVGWFIFAVEWLAARFVSLAILDTKTHADWISSKFGIPREKFRSVLLGFDSNCLPPIEPFSRQRDKAIRVLFFGQMIPLHGLEAIVAAIGLADPQCFKWTIVGSGQMEVLVENLLASHKGGNLTWEKWASPERLAELLATADVCLGIFGETEKAARVIPNKVFLALGAGRPIVTRDSPAMRELVGDGAPGITLVRPGCGRSILDGIRQAACFMADDRHETRGAEIRRKMEPRAIGGEFLKILCSLP